MNDVMVDIEALGNGKNGLICQIGACYFDRRTGEIGKTFKVNIDPVDAQKHGAELDADTVIWWLSQSQEARESILNGDKLKLATSIAMFVDFVRPAKAIWSHATYDFVMLNETCRRLNMRQLPFRKARDIRTLVDMSGVYIKNIKREGTHHDALADCLHQVKYCVKCFKAIKENV